MDAPRRIVFYAHPLYEEALAAFCADEGHEYGVESKPGVEDRARFSVFPAGGGAPEPLVVPLAAALEGFRACLPELPVPGRLATRRMRTDWEKSFRRFFRGKPSGARFFIYPPWETPPADGTRLALCIDPGASFGTGHHPTTELCITFLEDLVRPGCRVLDLGCGTGVLSLAALFLGAVSAVGVDIDAEAVVQADGNAARNGLADRARFVTGSLEAAEAGPFDLVVANMLPREFLPLAADVRTVLGPGAVVIFSGMLAGDGLIPAEAEPIAAAGYRAMEWRWHEGWAAAATIPEDKRQADLK